MTKLEKLARVRKLLKIGVPITTILGLGTAGVYITKKKDWSDKEFAPGIPKKGKVSKFREIKNPEMWKFSIQKHTTNLERKKPKIHWDLRLGDKKTGRAHSYALPKGLPEPGQKTLAIIQSDHTIPYMSFEGVIREGYGKGKVELKESDPVLITKSSPKEIRFSIINKKYEQNYILRKWKEKKWLLQNITNTKKKRNILVVRPKYNETILNEIDLSNEEEILLPKLDGSYSALNIDEEGRVKAYSHRESKDKNPIQYSAKLPYLDNIKFPKEFSGTTLRSELLAFNPKTKRVIKAEEVSGILNSSPLKARKTQKIKGSLIPFVFDIAEYKGINVENLSYKERRKLVKEVVSEAKKLKVIPIVETPREKSNLIRAVKQNRFGLTREGVIIINYNKPKAKFSKSKIKSIIDVKIIGFTEGIGRLKNKGIGSLIVLLPGSRTPTKIGTGFSDKLRKDIYKNWDNYKSRIAEIEVLDVFASKAHPGEIGKARGASFKKFKSSDLAFYRFHPEKK